MHNLKVRLEAEDARGNVYVLKWKKNTQEGQLNGAEEGEEVPDVLRVVPKDEAPQGDKSVEQSRWEQHEGAHTSLVLLVDKSHEHFRLADAYGGHDEKPLRLSCSETVIEGGIIAVEQDDGRVGLGVTHNEEDWWIGVETEDGNGLPKLFKKLVKWKMVEQEKLPHGAELMKRMKSMLMLTALLPSWWAEALGDKNSAAILKEEKNKLKPTYTSTLRWLRWLNRVDELRVHFVREAAKVTCSNDAAAPWDDAKHRSKIMKDATKFMENIEELQRLTCSSEHLEKATEYVKWVQKERDDAMKELKKLEDTQKENKMLAKENQKLALMVDSINEVKAELAREREDGNRVREELNEANMKIASLEERLTVAELMQDENENLTRKLDKAQQLLHVADSAERGSGDMLEMPKQEPDMQNVQIIQTDATTVYPERLKPTANGEVRFMQWNVADLNFGTEKLGPFWPERFSNILSTISHYTPDVVVLEEVRKPNILNQLLHGRLDNNGKKVTCPDAMGLSKLGRYTGWHYGPMNSPSDKRHEHFIILCRTSLLDPSLLEDASAAKPDAERPKPESVVLTTVDHGKRREPRPTDDLYRVCQKLGLPESVAEECLNIWKNTLPAQTDKQGFTYGVLLVTLRLSSERNLHVLVCHLDRETTHNLAEIRVLQCILAAAWEHGVWCVMLGDTNADEANTLNDWDCDPEHYVGEDGEQDKKITLFKKLDGKFREHGWRALPKEVHTNCYPYMAGIKNMQAAPKHNDDIFFPRCCAREEISCGSACGVAPTATAAWAKSAQDIMQNHEIKYGQKSALINYALKYVYSDHQPCIATAVFDFPEGHHWLNRGDPPGLLHRPDEGA